MKSRIINTKHLTMHLSAEGDVFIGYTSELKPSLFYFDRPEVARHDLYIQFMGRENKMVKFTFVTECKDNSGNLDHIDVFEPTRKFKEKYEWCRNMKLHIKYDKANLFGDSNRPIHKKKSYKFKKGENKSHA